MTEPSSSGDQPATASGSTYMRHDGSAATPPLPGVSSTGAANSADAR